MWNRGVDGGRPNESFGRPRRQQIGATRRPGLAAQDSAAQIHQSTYQPTHTSTVPTQPGPLPQTMQTQSHRPAAYGGTYNIASQLARTPAFGTANNSGQIPYAMELRESSRDGTGRSRPLQRDINNASSAMVSAPSSRQREVAAMAESGAMPAVLSGLDELYPHQQGFFSRFLSSDPQQETGRTSLATPHALRINEEDLISGRPAVSRGSASVGGSVGGSGRPRTPPPARRRNSSGKVKRSESQSRRSSVRSEREGKAGRDKVRESRRSQQQPSKKATGSKKAAAAATVGIGLRARSKSAKPSTSLLGKRGAAGGLVGSLAYFATAYKGPMLVGAAFVLLMVPLITGGDGAEGNPYTVSGDPYLSSKPNIIIVFPDDNGHNDVNFTMPDVWKPFKTPNLDSLAFSGVRFSTYYSASTCTPARCSVLTGRYIPRTGCFGDADLKDAWGLPLSELTIANYLHDQGYYTTMFGKWHLGAFQKSFHPLSRGFDHFVGFLGGGGGYYDHDDNGYDWWYDDEIDESVDGVYSTYVLNASIQSFLYKYGRSRQPWFMYLPTKVPHGDYTAPEEMQTLFSGNYAGSQTGAWIAEIGMLDDLVGSIVYYLKDIGVYQNTVIIYAGDHGADGDNPNYDGSKGRDYPFSGGKGNNYEGGVRTPAFIHSPLLSSKLRGTETTQIVSVYDWLPTIAALGGASIASSNPVDGWNLAPWLFSGKSLSGHANREVLISLKPCNKNKKKKGGDNMNGENMDDMDMNNGPATAFRYGNYKMLAGCVDPTYGPEWAALYDIVNDYTESYDLLTYSYNTYSSVAQTMITRLKYFASVAVDPDEVCDGCSQGCANNGVWGAFYDENWDYTNYC